MYKFEMRNDLLLKALGIIKSNTNNSKNEKFILLENNKVYLIDYNNIFYAKIYCGEGQEEKIPELIKIPFNFLEKMSKLKENFQYSFDNETNKFSFISKDKTKGGNITTHLINEDNKNYTLKITEKIKKDIIRANKIIIDTDSLEFINNLKTKSEILGSSIINSANLVKDEEGNSVIFCTDEQKVALNKKKLKDKKNSTYNISFESKYLPVIKSLTKNYEKITGTMTNNTLYIIIGNNELKIPLIQNEINKWERIKDMIERKNISKSPYFFIDKNYLENNLASIRAASEHNKKVFFKIKKKQIEIKSMERNNEFSYKIEAKTGNVNETTYNINLVFLLESLKGCKSNIKVHLVDNSFYLIENNIKDNENIFIGPIMQI